MFVPEQDIFDIWRGYQTFHLKKFFQQKKILRIQILKIVLKFQFFSGFYQGISFFCIEK